MPPPAYIQASYSNDEYDQLKTTEEFSSNCTVKRHWKGRIMSITNKDEITSEVSARVCRHMNDDHGVSVYAMAKSIHTKSSNITNAKMTHISFSNCQLQVTTCSGDVCEMKILTYEFNPPLKSQAEIRTRVVEEHHKVCSPYLHWLYTKPDAIFVSLLMLSLAYAVVFDNQVERTLNQNVLRDPIVEYFGSTRYFVRCMKYLFILLVVAHLGEGMFVCYHSMNTLKVGPSSTLSWTLLVSMIGWPITSEFVDLLKIHSKNKAARKGK